MKLSLFVRKHVHMDSAILLCSCLLFGAGILLCVDAYGVATDISHALVDG